MPARTWLRACVLMMIVAVAALETYRYGEADVSQHALRQQPMRTAVAPTVRPPASARADDALDARGQALVATLLLEGARHGWHAR